MKKLFTLAAILFTFAALSGRAAAGPLEEARLESGVKFGESFTAAATDSVTGGGSAGFNLKAMETAAGGEKTGLTISPAKHTPIASAVPGIGAKRGVKGMLNDDGAYSWVDNFSIIGVIGVAAIGVIVLLPMAIGYVAAAAAAAYAGASPAVVVAAGVAAAVLLEAAFLK